MNRFWNLGLEKMLNMSSIIRESQNFHNDPISEEIYPEGTADFQKPKSVTLDLLGK